MKRFMLIAALMSLGAICVVGCTQPAGDPIAVEVNEDRHTFALMTIAFLALVLCTLLHYEAFRLWTWALKRFAPTQRTSILLVVFGLLFVHLVEIELFAIGYQVIDKYLDADFSGDVSGGMRDYFYYSAVTYTTLGFGDIVPVGDLRFLTAIESLAGMVLVGWSVTFTLLVMQHRWDVKDASHS